MCLSRVLNPCHPFLSVLYNFLSLRARTFPNSIRRGLLPHFAASNCKRLFNCCAKRGIIRGDGNHVKALLRITPSLLTACAKYAALLFGQIGGIQHSGNGFIQLWIHLSVNDGMADVIAQIKRTDKENIDKRRYFLHSLQGLFGLDLNHGQEAVVCLLEIL